MKLKAMLPWLCVVALAIGVAALYSANQSQGTELAKLREESQELQRLRAGNEEAKAAQTQSENEELARLRKDHEDVLRLRNEIRQLRDEKTQLGKQLQSAQAQVQNAQAQSGRANPSLPNPPAALPQLSPEQQAEFRKRYGLETQQLSPDLVKSNTCLNNLRQIEAAKQQWALEKGRPAGGLVGPTDIAAYLPGNTVPTCPSGGIYTINPIGIGPICNTPGHALPK
jgi:hypothetical protein